MEESKLEQITISRYLRRTSTLSTPLEFVLSHGNIKLDLRDKSDRIKAVTEVLSCASNAKHLKETGRFGDQIHDKYARDVLRYALIVHDSQFATTLSYINKQFTQMKAHMLNANTLTKNFIELLLLFFGAHTCHVVLKYIFRKKSNLWKPLLASIINALMSFPISLEKNGYYTPLTFFLQNCIYHCRKQHFLFIINNNVCKLFKQNIITIWNKHLHPNGVASYDMDAHPSSRHSLYWICAMLVCYAKKIDNKNKNRYVLSHFQQKLFSEFEGLIFNDKFNERKRLYFYNNFKFMSTKHRHESIYKGIKFDMAACQWFRCFKFRRFDINNLKRWDKPCKLYKCKGCRLVFYCCRNHQKKDWKYLHSQQCLNIY
eukprot:437630_1